jgi:hypothetical protein
MNRKEVSRRRVEKEEKEEEEKPDIVIEKPKELKEPKEEKENKEQKEDKKKFEPNLEQLKNKLKELEEQKRKNLLKAQIKYTLKKYLVRKFGYSEEEAKQLAQFFIEHNITNLKGIKEYFEKEQLEQKPKEQKEQKEQKENDVKS